MQESSKEYSEKQKFGAATKAMLKLAWDLQELSAINDLGRSLLVECEVLSDKLKDPVYDGVQDNCARKLTCFRENLSSFVQRVSRYHRKAASHLLVVMISTEDRKTKPYALPVQCIPYRSLKDVEVRNIANRVIEEMQKRGMKVAGILLLFSGVKHVDLPFSFFPSLLFLPPSI